MKLSQLFEQTGHEILDIDCGKFVAKKKRNNRVTYISGNDIDVPINDNEQILYISPSTVLTDKKLVIISRGKIRILNKFQDKVYVSDEYANILKENVENDNVLPSDILFYLNSGNLTPDLMLTTSLTWKQLIDYIASQTSSSRIIIFNVNLDKGLQLLYQNNQQEKEE